MSLAWLRASLRTWQLKAKFNERKYKAARSSADRKKYAAQRDHAKGMVARRHRQIVSKQRKNRKAAAKTTGVGRYDGVPVANWMVPYLQWARENGWKGRLVSGWRDPNYSRSLCMRMCGAPRCPGRCAGTSSNHVGSVKPHGAIDVSSYEEFGRLMARCPLEPKLINRLGARDPVHYSVSGN